MGSRIQRFGVACWLDLVAQILDSVEPKSMDKDLSACGPFRFLTWLCGFHILLV